MNKKKISQQKRILSPVEIGFYLLAALVVIAGGVNYAILKNQQVALDREIDKVYQSAKRYDMETNSIMVEIDRKINRFAIRSELRELGSIMQERPDVAVEKVHPVAPPVVHNAELESIYPNLFISNKSLNH